jgi:archaellum component FlaG (FlaF/FlaG flagellin family)
VDRTRLRIIECTTAALAALILSAGVGVVLTRDGSSSTRVLTSAGQGSSAQVEEDTATASVPLPPSLPAPTVPLLPPTTVAERTSTTRPPSNASPATRSPTPGAQDPAPAPPSTTPVASTSAMVTLVNHHSGAVSVGLNGQSFQLAPGQIVGPVAITPAPSGNDDVSVRMVDETDCGLGDAMSYFPAGASVRFTVTTSRGLCRSGQPAPDYAVSTA